MHKKLRIRHAGGSTTIENTNGTAKEVGQRIQEITGILLQEQEWRCGYPPRPVLLRAEAPLPPEVDSVFVTKGGQPSLQFAETDDSDKKKETQQPSIPFDIGAVGVEPSLVDPEGYVVRRVVDADNSCLFHSVGRAFQQPPSKSSSLRLAVAHTVLADPTTYSDAFLERPTAEYASWIQESTSWGGQIELSILSQLLQTEIAALDIIRNRHDIYGTEHNYHRRIYVIYDGIHYDALAYCFDPQLPPDMDVTIFSPNDVFVLERAKEVCHNEHQRKAYTDTSNFTLRCLVCQQGLRGQQEAAQHAQATGHSNFAEFR
jgi:ubiquitin thioesterase OTU1